MRVLESVVRKGQLRKLGGEVFGKKEAAAAFDRLEI